MGVKTKVLYSLILILMFSACTTPDEPMLYQTQKKSLKRGVSYGFSIIDADTKLLSPGVSWFYNWAPDISAELDAAAQALSLDFVPMAWNGEFDAARIRLYKLSHPECEYILGFNEPNLTDQANLTPTQAAAKWTPLIYLAKELNLKIVSPAMNYGTLTGYTDPIVWLDEFFTMVPLSQIDAIAIHCYMSNTSALASYVARFKKYGKPIWLTEFCGWENSTSNAAAQIYYMSEAVQYLESESAIARYAWFIPRASGSVDSFPFMQLLTKTQPYQLTEQGTIFVNMSTLDKETYYPEAQEIPAEHYSSSSFEETVKNNNWANCVHFRATKDVTGALDVTDFNTDQWLEYLVFIESAKNKKLNIRYTSLYNASCEILVDGLSVNTFELPKVSTINAYQNKIIDLPISNGNHALRIKIKYGGTTLNWLKIE